MSLSDCEKCWSTPCECGHDYRNWDLARLKKFYKVIGDIIASKEGICTTPDEWGDISTAPTNVWLVCRNANKRVFEAMKCSTLKNYCWVDRAKLQRDPKEWNRTLSLPEIENHD